MNVKKNVYYMKQAPKTAWLADDSMHPTLQWEKSASGRHIYSSEKRSIWPL